MHSPLDMDAGLVDRQQMQADSKSNRPAIGGVAGDMPAIFVPWVLVAGRGVCECSAHLSRLGLDQNSLPSVHQASILALKQ